MWEVLGVCLLVNHHDMRVCFPRLGIEDYHIHCSSLAFKSQFHSYAPIGVKRPHCGLEKEIE